MKELSISKLADALGYIATINQFMKQVGELEVAVATIDAETDIYKNLRTQLFQKKFAVREFVRRLAAAVGYDDEETLQLFANHKDSQNIKLGYSRIVNEIQSELRRKELLSSE